jgi:ABC-2 type transport system ATP-binding protein
MSEMEVRGLPLERIGDVALAAGVPLYLLAPARASLEEAFMELTAGSVEYQAGGPEPRQRAHVTATEA